MGGSALSLDRIWCPAKLLGPLELVLVLGNEKLVARAELRGNGARV